MRKWSNLPYLWKYLVQALPYSGIAFCRERSPLVLTRHKKEMLFASPAGVSTSWSVPSSNSMVSKSNPWDRHPAVRCLAPAKTSSPSRSRAVEASAATTRATHAVGNCQERAIVYLRNSFLDIVCTSWMSRKNIYAQDNLRCLIQAKYNITVPYTGNALYRRCLIQAN